MFYFIIIFLFTDIFSISHLIKHSMSNSFINIIKINFHNSLENLLKIINFFKRYYKNLFLIEFNF